MHRVITLTWFIRLRCLQIKKEGKYKLCFIAHQVSRNSFIHFTLYVPKDKLSQSRGIVLLIIVERSLSKRTSFIVLYMSNKFHLILTFKQTMISLQRMSDERLFRDKYFVLFFPDPT